MTSAHAVRKAAITSLRSSGSSVLANVIELTTSQNMTVSCRNSPDVLSRNRAPQYGQNFASAGACTRHFLQYGRDATAMPLPECRQMHEGSSAKNIAAKHF